MGRPVIVSSDPGIGPTRSYTWRPIGSQQGVHVFFYELHEGDNEVFADVIVVSESEWEPEEFFELVQSIRRRIQDTFVHDTLSEAIAVELEREHGFIHVSDDSLVASVNVSLDEAENFLVRTSVELADAEEDEDVDDDDEEDDVDYKAVIVEFDPGSRLN
jgi:glucose-6-phosphate isomerase